jgi:hypothetical protein
MGAAAMSAANVIGIALLASPFVAVAVYATAMLGWRSALVAFAIWALVVGVVTAGAYLVVLP